MNSEDIDLIPNVDPVPIKDVYSEEIQGCGSFAVREHNETTGEKLEFERVINGLEQGRRSIRIVFTLVLVAKNSCGINWTYTAKEKCVGAKQIGIQGIR
ncbi:uncharacterized protein LOC120080488 isoform X2 [Benincasa hispida]|uniref:uncharacterized protein LOC120080488 isoform X2 n=1 Tax=Benincasa hispida TaxID=102211 RepID=UPI001900CB66|nr:uncharacterized protein LOC120080488 isoform X2 [Benincasa hispida]